MHCRGGIIGDPHVTLFDGTDFMWHGVGPFELLRESDGWVVSATFEPSPNGDAQVTWTTEVHIEAPNGALPPPPSKPQHSVPAA